ncbi:MAG: Alpha/beta knot methyltransferase [Monoraphidium minutum]|nr:MAG: Alpha/beta knot methyltransferase [Monoraphidium minutum]
MQALGGRHGIYIRRLDYLVHGYRGPRSFGRTSSPAAALARHQAAAAAAAAAAAPRRPPAARPRRGPRPCRSAPAPPPPPPHAALPPLLGDVRVVLVAPKTPSNVGAAARACANFEALDLVIVAPRCDPREGEAYKIACGPRVLDAARVLDSLPAALADCTGSVGFTRRAGSTRLTHVSVATMLRDFPGAIPGMAPPQRGSSSGGGSGGEQQGGAGLSDEQLEAEVERQLWREAAPPGAAGAAEEGAAAAGDLWSEIASQGTTALVFGREESGLTEDELRLCTHACAIPTGRVQPSMNLSHAVGAVLAGLFERRLAALGLEELPMGQDVTGNPKIQAGLQPASASELESLLGRVAAIARAVDMSDQESHGGGNQGNHGRRRLPLGHIRALMARAKANTWEVRSLHGLAKAVLDALGGDKGGAP